MDAIQIGETGGPEVMSLVELNDPVAGSGEVVVEVAAAGLNFIDTYQRTGLYDVTLPYVLGLEGAGVVSEIGDGVDGLDVGSRVAWTSIAGSYASRVVVPASSAVVVPDAVSLETAAAAMLQGLTAHYLVTDTYPLGPSDSCVIHAAAGGVGLLLVQMAKMKGATIFATVGTEAKAELARAAGADHVILYRNVDFGDAVIEIAGAQAIDVVYDGVGASTFDRGIELLRSRGMMVTFGNASGPVPPKSPIEMSGGKSAFVTRPSLFHYIAGEGELQQRCDEMFGWIQSGKLDVRIGHRFELADAAEAHRQLEGRTTTGKVLLIP